MASQRNTILEYLYGTLFPTITQANGYNFNIGLTERGLRSFDELMDSEFPCLFVASADEERRNVTNKDFQSKMVVYLYGGVKSEQSRTQAELDKFIEDVTKSIYVNPTQGGRVAYTDILRVVTDEGDRTPHAFFRMEVEFMYKQAGTSP